MDETLLDTLEADDLDMLGYGEDIGDDAGEYIDDDAGEDIDELEDEDVEGDYYSEEPEAAEARYRSPYYNLRRRRALLQRRALLRRRALQRQMALRRQRAMMRARSGYGRRYIPSRRSPRYFPRTTMGAASKPQVRSGFKRVGADVQSNRANIKKVDLESKVKTDTLVSALRGQQKQISRNEYALAATKVVDEFKEQFPDLNDNKVIKTALPLAPLLFLKPKKRGSGFESVITDPRVWGPLLAAGAAFYNESKGDQKPDEVTVDPPVQALAAGATSPFSAVARDSKGKEIEGRKFRWYSRNPAVASIDINTGVVTIQAGAAAGDSAEIIVVDTNTGKSATANVTIS